MIAIERQLKVLKREYEAIYKTLMSRASGKTENLFKNFALNIRFTYINYEGGYNAAKKEDTNKLSKHIKAFKKARKRLNEMNDEMADVVDDKTSEDIFQYLGYLDGLESNLNYWLEQIDIKRRQRLRNIKFS